AAAVQYGQRTIQVATGHFVDLDVARGGGRGGSVGVLQEQGGGGRVQHSRLRWGAAGGIEDHAQWLPAVRGGGSDGQLRVIGALRARADQHGIDGVTQVVDIRAGGLAGDPAAGAVSRGRAPVEGGGEFPPHVWTAEAHGREPGAVHLGGVRGELGQVLHVESS